MKLQFALSVSQASLIFQISFPDDVLWHIEISVVYRISTERLCVKTPVDGGGGVRVLRLTNS